MLSTVDLNLPEDISRQLLGYLTQRFDEAVEQRRTQVDSDYKRWQDNYAAKPVQTERTTPFIGASNFVPELIRMHSDIFSANLCNLLFASKPFWYPRTLLREAIPHETLDLLSAHLEYLSFARMNLFTPIDRLLILSSKVGTTVAKCTWATKDTVGRELDSQGNIRELRETISDLYCETIPFEDFYLYPITASTLDQAEIIFHRIRLTEEQVKYRRLLGIWPEEACNTLLGGPDTNSERISYTAEAIDAGLDDQTLYYSVIEAHLEYPLDYTPTRIIVTFDPRTRTLLRGIYNYYPARISPFIDMHLMPRDHFFYDYSIPELLEQSQEEQAQIHNARRDANTIANVPTFKKRRYSNTPDPLSSWYPGKVWELEDVNDLELFAFPGNYNSMLDEESFLMQLAERYTGVQTPMQGFGAGMMEGKRGIYNSQGTLALLAEGNKRQDIYLKRCRIPFHKLGNCIAYSYSHFRDEQPELDFLPDGQKLKAFYEQTNEVTSNVLYDIASADAGVNRELDRQNLLLLSNTLAAYYRQLVESSTMLLQLPPGHPLQSVLLSVLTGARDLANRLLFVFNIGDRERILPDITKQSTNLPGMPGAQDALNQQQLQNIQNLPVGS